MKSIKLFSYGAGVQSFATLVLQTQGKLAAPYDVFIFANVGHDSENPKTIEHYENVAKPLAAKFGIPMIEVQKTRKGEPDTVWQSVMRDNLSTVIPIFFPSGKQAQRACTSDFKIRVVAKWVKDNKYTHADVGLGISTDEIQRRKSEEWETHFGTEKLGFTRKYSHPLLDLLISRNACENLIRNAGYEIPAKSACFFCPFRRRGEWIEMKRDEPELFAKAVALEKRLNEKYALINDRTRKEHDHVVTIHPDKLPLEQAVGDQLSLWGEYMDADEGCQSGYCGL